MRFLVLLCVVAGCACGDGADQSDPNGAADANDSGDSGRADAPDAAEGRDTDDTSDAQSDAGGDTGDGDGGGDDDALTPDAPDTPEDVPDADATDTDAADADAALEDATDADVPEDLGPDCADELVPAAVWPDAAQEAWDGRIELAQTHVVEPDEQRLAPVPVEGRATLVLFTPESPIADDATVLLSAWEGEALLGVLVMGSPMELPASLEAGLTDASVPAYTEAAWSAVLPYPFVREGVSLQVGHMREGALRVFQHALVGLAAPHRITISRTKMVLFGESDFDTSTVPATKVAQDYFATIPAAELRFVDGNPWRLSEFVVRTPEGPRLVRSEAERREVASDEDHWSILKHQFALRMSLANTGRGLALTGESQGDSSPYSFGTSVGMGWFRTPEGQYRDIDDAPWAAGWTGWTAMWASECGNGFTHEVGHSFTLAHFTNGAAANWGIDDEYPLDGTNVEGHPWGWDTTRGQFRTWFRVDGNGPVMAEGQPVGKRDPMNGGESPNAVTCFPQYTGYHAQKAQDWFVSSPTIREVDGAAGVYLWDAQARTYVRQAVGEDFQEPVAVDVPVATVVGTLGNVDEANQVYPPIYLPSGNAFVLPDPFEPGLPPVFEGAQWFLEIGYADAASDYALIARGAVEDAALYLFSLNIALHQQPTHVRLFWAPTGYPDIALEDAQLIHDRALDPPAAFAPIVTVGHGKVANAGLRLTTRCEDGINCGPGAATSTWRAAGAPLRFEIEGGLDPVVCSPADSYTEFTVRVRDGESAADLTLRAQRVVAGGGSGRAVPLHDATRWIDSPDATQSLRIWAPFAPNRALPAGHYRLAEPVSIAGFLGDAPFSATPLDIDIEVLEPVEVDLATTLVSEPLTSADSSMYFVVRDPSVGPTERVWWGGAGPTPLRVAVLEEGTQTAATLLVHAQQEACGQRWDLHAGRGAGNCEHRVVLQVADAGNEALQPGRTYTTPASAPLVIEGRRWHAPDARRLEGVHVFSLTYSP